MIISGIQELTDHIKSTFPKRLSEDNSLYSTQKYIIKDKVFKNYIFTKDLTRISLQGCKFVDCTFEDVWGFYLVFGRCKFINCEFKNSRITHLEMSWNELDFNNCVFKNVQIDEGCIYNISFNNCQFYTFTLMDMNPIEGIHFVDCTIINSQFKYLVYYQKGEKIEQDFKDLRFHNCQIEASSFTNVDFRNSCISDSILLQVSFIDCKLMPKSILRTKKLKHDSYAAIDFQSILKSEFNADTLKEYFNINDPLIKEIINKVTTKVEYRRIFISFSFKDLKFANRLHKELTDSGVICFFWMKDAPPGVALQDIMTGHIKANEKILFIASEASIKSQACQFELSLGRKKQEEIWEDVLFPIHIDNYLFDVEKHRIRPVDKLEEYWKNIEELRKVNSEDFKAFNKDRIDNKKFKNAVSKIMKQLTLNS